MRPESSRARRRRAAHNPSGRSEQRGDSPPAGRSRSAGLVALLLAVGTCALFAPGAAGQSDQCPNAAIRAAQGSSHLPDCMAWEKVSPNDKNGSHVSFGVGFTMAALDGNRVGFASTGSFGAEAQGAPRESDYLADRGAAGWATENVVQPASADPLGAQSWVQFGYQWYSPDMSFGAFTSNDAPSVDRNAYLRDFSTGVNHRLTGPSLTAIDPFTALVENQLILTGTDDGRQVLFLSPRQLTPDAPPFAGPSSFGYDYSNNLYEWKDGVVRFVAVLPDGSAASASTGGSYKLLEGNHFGVQNLDPILSDDGSRIFFTEDFSGTNSSTRVLGEVYMRENGATTTHISASQRTDCAGDETCGGDGQADPEPDAEGIGSSQFMTASKDGSVAVFTSCRKLSDDSNASCRQGPWGSDKYEMYRYEVDTGELESLSADLPSLNSGGNWPRVQISDDGSVIYFETFKPSVGVIGTNEWHMWRDGEVKSLQAESEMDDLNRLSMQASADGRYLLWLSTSSRVGNDTNGNHVLYVYDSQGDRIECVSCRPHGAATTASFIARYDTNVYSVRLGKVRGIDAAGRFAYFTTGEPLVAEDDNDDYDVYRYEMATGERRLMSGGGRKGDAYLAGIASDGSSVFISTDQRLTGSDSDDLRDLYVARVGGGFVEDSGPGSEDCVGDACQGAPNGRTGKGASPSSVGFRGAGDAAPPKQAHWSMKPLSAVQRAALARGSTVRLRVRVGRAGTIRATLRARIGRASRVVGSSTRRAPKAGVVTLKLRLSKPARHRLTAGRRLRAVLTVSAPAVGGTKRSVLDLAVPGKGR